MQKIIILDYTEGITYVIDFYEHVHMPEDIIESLELNTSDCKWMITDVFKLDMK